MTALYQIDQRFVRTGYGIGNYARRLDAFPTEHLPGSEEKIQVMMERAAADLCIFHPLDACDRWDHPGFPAHKGTADLFMERRRKDYPAS